MKLNYKSTVVNLKYFQTYLGDSPELIQTIIKHFIVDAPFYMDEMMNSVSVSDWETVRRIAHKIKPNIDTFGIDESKGLVRKIEANTRYEVNLEEVPALVKAMQEDLKEAVNELQRYVDVES